MVVLVSSLLLAAVAAFPFVGVLISRDCWVYRKVTGGLRDIQTAEGRGRRKRQQGRVASFLIGFLYCWQYYVFVFIVEGRTLSLWMGAYHVLLGLQMVAHGLAASVTSLAAPATLDGDPRGCPQCRRLRTCTTHHCATCAACVIGMDHHCILINNCVSINNRRLFLLLLFYACQVTTLLLGRTNPLLHRLTGCSVWGWEEGHILLGAVVTAFVGLGAACLLILHLFTVVHNVTMLDCLDWATYFPHCKPDLAQSRAEVLANLDAVFGPRRLLWWLPMPRAHGVLHKKGRPD